MKKTTTEKKKVLRRTTSSLSESMSSICLASCTANVSQRFARKGSTHSCNLVWKSRLATQIEIWKSLFL